MIDRSHDLPIACQARVLNISRGSVYYKPRPISAADLALMRRIDQLLERRGNLRPSMEQFSLGKGRLHCGEVNFGLEDLVDVIGEGVQREVGDDLDNLGIRIPLLHG